MNQLYRTIAADPPWLERGGGKSKRGADRHYDVLSKEEILKVMVNAPCWNPDSNGCHLYLWVTNNFLQDGLWLVDKLGFRYITQITWAKPSFGLGHYFRGQTEHMLFARMGGYITPGTKDESTLIEAPRGKHSEKPDEAYRKIEAVSRPPRLEMFARQPREGWIAWGDEAAMYICASCGCYVATSIDGLCRKCYNRGCKPFSGPLRQTHRVGPKPTGE